MITPAFQSYLVAIPCAVTAVVLAYDVKRAMAPRIAGERWWRQWRAGATVVAASAATFLNGATGSLWLKRVVMGGFVLACLVVLRCSIPLKRLVEETLEGRRP